MDYINNSSDRSGYQGRKEYINNSSDRQERRSTIYQDLQMISVTEKFSNRKQGKLLNNLKKKVSLAVLDPDELLSQNDGKDFLVKLIEYEQRLQNEVYKKKQRGMGLSDISYIRENYLLKSQQCNVSYDESKLGVVGRKTIQMSSKKR